MNPILFFSHVMLLITVIIGLGIFISFYHETKRRFFVFFIQGWIFMALGHLAPILSEFSPHVLLTEILILAYGMLTSTGVYLIALGIISYFVKVSIKYGEISSIILLILPIILFITLGLENALNFALITYAFSVITGLMPPLLKWKNFKKIIGKSIGFYVLNLIVVALYFPITVYIFSRGYSFGLFEANDNFLIMLNYLFIIGGVVLTIIYLIHLEFSIMNKERYDLKDKYSHNLGNILQTIFLSIEFLKAKGNMENSERVDLATMVEKKLDDAKKFLDEIRDLK